MGKDISAVFYGKRYRCHHALTERGPVTGIDINVSAPKAFWTVIGITVSLNSSTTLRAGEIFNVALEFFLHWSILIFFTCASLSNVRFRLGDTAAARSKFQWS